MLLVIFDLEPLYVRREQLCMSFAKKTAKSRHSDMFQKATYMYDTRQAKHTYKEHNPKMLQISVELSDKITEY